MVVLRVKVPLEVRLSLEPPVVRVDRLRGEPAAEEHVEDLFGRHVGLEAMRWIVLVKASAMTRRRTVGGLGAVEVVLTALLAVGQNREGVADGFEGLPGPGSLVLVRMKLERHFAI